jgi:radical SAM superfamily enzyme YgiQ (UPF0313 family)
MQGHFGITYEKIFPVGLVRVGTYLEKNNFTVEILDLNLYRNPLKKLLKRLKKEDYDIVGISLRNLEAYSISPLNIFGKTIKIIKNYSTVPIVVGGSGFTLFAKELMEKFNEIDFGIVGEGEETFLDLLKNLKKPKKVKGICYRRGKRIIFTGKRRPVKNLDLIPRKDLEGLPKNLKIYDSIGIEIGRGCKYKCLFCSYLSIWGTELRLRKPEVIVKEIEELKNNFNVDEIFFLGGCVSNSLHIEKVSNLLISKGINIRWSAYFREDIINKKLTEKLVRSGCIHMMFLSASGSNKILKILQRKIRVEEILNVGKVTREFENLIPEFEFFLNGPGETINTLKETFIFAYRMYKSALISKICKPCAGIRFNRIRIYPRTILYKMALKNNIIKKDTNLLSPTYYTSLPLNGFIKVFSASNKIFHNLLWLISNKI